MTVGKWEIDVCGGTVTALCAVVLGLLVAQLLPSPEAQGALDTKGNMSAGGCITGTTTELGDEKYLFVGGRTLQIMFEPDADGADADAQVTLYSCMEPDPEACEEAPYDTDYDGVPDSAVMTGSAWPLQERVWSDVQIAGYLRIYTSAAVADPDTDVAKWSVCGLATDE